MRYYREDGAAKAALQAKDAVLTTKAFQFEAEVALTPSDNFIGPKISSPMSSAHINSPPPPSCCPSRW